MNLDFVIPYNKENRTPLTIQCNLPEGVSIRPTKYGYGIFATKSFRKVINIYKYPLLLHHLR
jgi:hypothetical protein